MSISNKIKSIIISNGHKQQDIRETLGSASKQTLSLKFTNEAWKASDLIKIADFLQGSLELHTPNGNIIFNIDDIKKKER